MGRNILTPQEIRFIRSCQKWNSKFETIFAALFIFTVIIPVTLMVSQKVQGLDETFYDARYYSFAVCLGWLITFLNERWLRLLNKLIKLDAF